MTIRIAFLIICLPVINSLSSQITFNHRFSLNFPASILTNIVSSDSCYYIIGVIADSVPPIYPRKPFFENGFGRDPFSD